DCQEICNQLNCGNGFIDAGEECDTNDLGGNDCTTLRLGFTPGDLFCRFYCQFDASRCTTCGNGVVAVREECAPPGSAPCAGSCQRIPTCGAGFVDSPETCDDGNTVSGDGCSSTCLFEFINEVEPNDTEAQALANAHFTPPRLISGSISAGTDT